MKWDDIWKLVLAVLSSVGGIGAIIVFMVKICSNMIANKLSKKYELKLNKELEKYKAGIDNKTYISKARFDREFSMYQDLCEKNITMVYDTGAAVIIARGGQYPNINNTEEFIHLALQHIDDAEMANKRYAPFIAKEIFESYKKLGKQAYFIISLLDVWNMFETKNLIIRESCWEDLENFYQWERRPEVTEFFSIRDGQTMEDVVRKFVTDDNNSQFKQFTILLKAEEGTEPIGRIVLGDIEEGWKAEIWRIYIADTKPSWKRIWQRSHAVYNEILL